MNDQVQQAADQALGWFPYGIVGYIVYNVGLWLMLRKAGIPGWGAIIPLYNFYLTVKLAGWRGISVIWFIIPIANFVAYLLLCVGLGKAFGRGYLFYFGLVLLFPLFILILGAGSSRFAGKIAGPARP